MPFSHPTHTLPSGDALPLVGFGTWDMSDAEVRAAVPTALDHGYSHLDAAEGYQNQAAVGEVLADYDRDDLFLTSKVLPSDLDYEGVLAALSRTLNRLGTDYLDLYLIHWPNPAISLRETLHALERAHAEGRIRNVGVSNFGVYELKFARKIADVPIAVNQFELNPWFYREDLLTYCHDHDIVVEAAAPLGRAGVLNDPVITDLAEKYDVMPAQVALRWAVEKGVVVLPQSTTPDHIRANLALFDWSLDDADHARIDAIERRENAYYLDVDDPIYGISA